MLLLRFIRITRYLRVRRATGILLATGFLLFCLVGNSVTFYIFDRGLHEDLSWLDAFWYSTISITTIGYGDYYAQSFGARLGTIVFIVFFGLSAFSALFGIVIDGLASHLARGKKGIGSVMANNHVLIVNCPSVGRIAQIVREIQSESTQAVEMVVVSDDVDEIPLDEPHLLFVRGSTHDVETYRRAHVERARLAIVLSRDYNDPSSDAVVAAAAGVIGKLNPNIHIVAECVDRRHRSLFDTVRCDAVVPGLQIAGNLLVQEVHDPGISRLIEVITSNQMGATVYSTRVDSAPAQTYRALASKLLENNINALGYVREGETHTDFPAAPPQLGDRLLYISETRRTWDQLSETT